MKSWTRITEPFCWLCTIDYGPCSSHDIHAFFLAQKSLVQKGESGGWSLNCLFVFDVIMWFRPGGDLALQQGNKQSDKAFPGDRCEIVLPKRICFAYKAIHSHIYFGHFWWCITVLNSHNLNLPPPSTTLWKSAKKKGSCALGEERQPRRSHAYTN